MLIFTSNPKNKFLFDNSIFVESWYKKSRDLNKMSLDNKYILFDNNMSRIKILKM